MSTLTNQSAPQPPICFARPVPSRDSIASITGIAYPDGAERLEITTHEGLIYILLALASEHMHLFRHDALGHATRHWEPVNDYDAWRIIDADCNNDPADWA